ncbi:hypothetical protein SASPL_105208 [Salvia splendens]|uniref:USP domain-containing protein n=1 Tax=Salvia splendens TaxID=180675 RepID=A0A8X8YQ15_SALSN|nr:hypothetical protein SASPL_105208 [Salvia splendens]
MYCFLVQVLLFGSFSEDETCSLLTKKPSNPHKPEKRKETTANLPNLGVMFGSISDIRETKVGFSAGGGDTPPYTYTNQKGSNFRAVQVLDDNDEKDGNHYDEGIKLNGTVNDATVKTHDKVAHLKTDAQGITPRGLINSGNLCFLNATLQALLACFPFIQLLLGLRKRNIPKVGYPTLTAFAEFIGEFDVVGGTNNKKKDKVEIEVGRPFNAGRRPRQEDAQEFLSFIMDQMHDGLLKLGGKSHLDERNPTLISTSEDDEWETVGRKNKSAVTRTQCLSFRAQINFWWTAAEYCEGKRVYKLSSIPINQPSRIYRIHILEGLSNSIPWEFGDWIWKSGDIHDRILLSGNKASVTVEPFLLHISGEVIRTIEDALRLFSTPETLDEYRATTAGKVGVVAARKFINIKTIPKIMILHLKRFSYGSTKLHKPVHFPLDLALSRDLIVSSNVEHRMHEKAIRKGELSYDLYIYRYELVATVRHHGREASKGLLMSSGCVLMMHPLLPSARAKFCMNRLMFSSTSNYRRNGSSYSSTIGGQCLLL